MGIEEALSIKKKRISTRTETEKRMSLLLMTIRLHDGTKERTTTLLECYSICTLPLPVEKRKKKGGGSRARFCKGTEEES